MNEPLPFSLPKLIPSNARQLAWMALEQYRENGTFLSDSIEKWGAELIHRERYQGQSLAETTVVHRLTINAVLQKVISGSHEDIEAPLWTILQLGAAQLVFRPQISEHAAINETVELASWLKMDRWTGYINGVLRGCQRLLCEELTQTPSAWSIPVRWDSVTRGEYRKSYKPLFADPEKNPVRFLSVAFNFPRWLAKKWLKHLTFEEITEIGFHFSRTGFSTLRINPMKTDRGATLQKILDLKIAASEGEHPLSICIKQPIALSELPGFDAGEMSVQDQTAMQAVTLLDPQQGETVLDLCSAPGTKSCQIAEAMHDQGTVVAADVSESRLEKVKENISRIGLNIIETRLIGKEEETFATYFPESFDAILVDAPCSNTGVLGKRPEARWRISSQDIQELTLIQKTLLEKTLPLLKPNGRLVYSTCSIEPEENDLLIEAFLAENPEMEFVSKHFALPNRNNDGGYAALMTKKS